MNTFPIDRTDSAIVCCCLENACVSEVWNLCYQLPPSEYLFLLSSQPLWGWVVLPHLEMLSSEKWIKFLKNRKCILISDTKIVIKKFLSLYLNFIIIIIHIVICNHHWSLLYSNISFASSTFGIFDFNDWRILHTHVRWNAKNKKNAVNKYTTSEHINMKNQCIQHIFSTSSLISAFQLLHMLAINLLLNSHIIL